MAQDDSSTVYRVGLLGASGIGKTSLVTALLAESQKMLAGSGVTMYAAGKPTQDRLGDNQRELEGHLLTRKFQVAALRGTSESFTFSLGIYPDAGEWNAGIELLDFPGGWLSGSEFRPGLSADREVLWDFLADAEMLLVPVDAVMLMESRSEEKMKAYSRLSGLDDMRIAVRDWAAGRRGRRSGYALAIFCPVKCETYFSDNGGASDRSGELYQKFVDAYADILRVIREEAPGIAILYAPVDTLGCVELTHVTWSAEGGLDLQAAFRVREPARISRVGAADVVRALCREIYQASRRISADESRDLRLRAQDASALAERREGPFRDLWLWVSRRRFARRKAALSLAQQAMEAERNVKALDSILDHLGETAYGPRVRKLARRTQIYVRTRGRARSSDYQFLGQAPQDSWWRSYTDVTDLGAPTVLVESDGLTWRLFMAGLPSGRVDIVGRPWQFTIVMEGDCDPADKDDHDLAVAIIVSFIDAVAEPKDPYKIAPGRLAGLLSDRDVEQLLRNPGPETAAQVAAVVRDAYSDLITRVGNDAEAMSQRWVAGLGSSRGRAQFIALAARLLAGQAGRALMLSYIKAEQDIERVPAGVGDLGVLISQPGPHFMAEPKRLPRQSRTADTTSDR